VQRGRAGQAVGVPACARLASDTGLCPAKIVNAKNKKHCPFEGAWLESVLGRKRNLC